jgi:hypothetical protein
MSRSNGNGTPLRAALKAVKHKRRLVSRAVEATATASRDEVLRPDEDERKEAEDGDPTGSDGGSSGGA